MPILKIAEHIHELPFGSEGLCEIKISGKKICIILQQNQLHACAAKCPHAGGRLADGYLDAQGNIVCPIHRYKFSLQNGRNSNGEGYFLKTYRVWQDENGVFIEMTE